MQEDYSNENSDQIDYQRDIIQLQDGGTMSVDWLWPDELVGGKEDGCIKNTGTHKVKYRVIIVIPGIGGHS